MPRIKAFDRIFKLDVGNAVREHRAQALLSQFCALARVTEIVWYQVEALRLRRAVTGEVNHDCIFRLRAFQRVEWTSFKRRWTSLAGESLDRRNDVCFRGVLVE